MIADLLVDAGWCCRQFIVKAIKQDALAACDQAFDVRSSEIEMPDLRIFELIIPVTDPRKRCIHNDPPRHPRRV